MEKMRTPWFIRTALFCGVFIVWSLVLVDMAPAIDPPPPPPPPPSGSLGGTLGQAVAVGAIAVYGVLRLRRK
jgi:hypothetical protein